MDQVSAPGLQNSTRNYGLAYVYRIHYHQHSLDTVGLSEGLHSCGDSGTT